jgi:hypothetical protein
VAEQPDAVSQLKIRSYRERNAFSPPSIWWQISVFISFLCSASLRRPEQVDRLSRLDDDGWKTLKELISSKSLSSISLDLPTSYVALENHRGDEFTAAMLRAINAMMLDMLAAIARKDSPAKRKHS